MAHVTTSSAFMYKICDVSPRSTLVDTTLQQADRTLTLPDRDVVFPIINTDKLTFSASTTRTITFTTAFTDTNYGLSVLTTSGAVVSYSNKTTTSIDLVFSIETTEISYIAIGM